MSEKTGQARRRRRFEWSLPTCISVYLPWNYFADTQGTKTNNLLQLNYRNLFNGFCLIALTCCKINAIILASWVKPNRRYLWLYLYFIGIRSFYLLSKIILYGHGTDESNCTYTLYCTYYNLFYYATRSSKSYDIKKRLRNNRTGAWRQYEIKEWHLNLGTSKTWNAFNLDVYW